MTIILVENHPDLLCQLVLVPGPTRVVEEEQKFRDGARSAAGGADGNEQDQLRALGPPPLHSNLDLALLPTQLRSSVLGIHEEGKHLNGFHYLKKKKMGKKKKKPTLVRALRGDESTHITFSLRRGHKVHTPPTPALSSSVADPSAAGAEGLPGAWSRKCELKLMRDRDAENQLSS